MKRFVACCFIGIFLFYINTSEANALILKRKDMEHTGYVIWEVPTSAKVIALTFDDGPNQDYTPQILSILKKHRAQATFFTVGRRMQENPRIAKRIAKEGHELGNHTMTHMYMKAMGVDQIKNEVNRAEKEIKKLQPNGQLLFRPPGGYVNPSLLQFAKEQGYTIILWSWHQDTYDWSGPSAQKIANHVLGNARNGDIVLMHDGGGNRTQTVEALKIIIPALQQRGYKCITISELLKHRDKQSIPFKNKDKENL
ncbi:polysaccharide deacetylase family protein [Microbacteriaceae bacterium 4G12]